jgi:predicted nucleic acid-binding protein
MNGAKAFLDTNVLLCMFGSDARKRDLAKELFRQYSRVGRMVLSTREVQEFYAAGSRKLGMPRPELRDAAAALLDCPLVVIGPSRILSARALPTCGPQKRHTTSRGSSEGTNNSSSSYHVVPSRILNNP